MIRSCGAHWLASVIAWLLVGLVAPAAANHAALCDIAAMRASAATGVPVAVLRAVALTETGRKIDGRMQPWPWTVNHAGDGRWFATPQEAIAFATATIEGGSRNVDIGCFQINHRWHADAFSSLEAMLDPDTNAAYAARFLRELHEESGDWSIAAGAFHSRTTVFANRYRNRFDLHLAAVSEEPLPLSPVSANPGIRLNAYPLLQRGNGGARGSLVPQVSGRPGLLGAPLAPLFQKG